MPDLPGTSDSNRAGPPSAALGTFLGVYTPTVLTILGVIMYLRFGWVTGHAGLARTLLIVTLANGITLVTSLSLSAIATNGKVGIGGAYFIISRSLGLEVGGAIGLPLFLSQALSVTLYAYGLAESLTLVWPAVPVPAAAFVIVVLVGLVSLRGAGAAVRIQVPILGLIALSLVALGSGTALRFDGALLSGSAPSGAVGFWEVFAVFFPAVTGIMAGLGLSGDLRDPMRSISRGTLAAVLTGFAVYLVIPLLLAAAANPEMLREDPLVWAQIAPAGPWLVLPGLWGAIFSSAVGSVLGAPRTLQAMALDGLAPRRLGRVHRRIGEPVLGLAVTLAISLGAVLLGGLNAVAQVVSMFFLTVYGTMNIVAALENISGDPSWRPQVRVPWAVSLAGGVACVGVMLLISPSASLVAILAELALWLALRRRERSASWGDVRRGLLEATIRWSLVRISRLPETARSWRPHILLFVERVEERLSLVRFADWFSQGRGIVTVCEMWESDLPTLDRDPRDRRLEIEEVLAAEGLTAFGEVDIVRTIEEGLYSVAQANGIAGIASNSLMLGWPQSLDRLETWLRVARHLEPLKKSLILGRAAEGAPRRSTPTIHVWWGGLERNGDLMLLLAFLLSRNAVWRRAEIRVLSIASNEMIRASTEQNLERLLDEIRIEAEVEVVPRPRQGSIAELIRERSHEADAVFLGLALCREGEERDYAERLTELTEGLETFFLVRNGSLFVGDLVTPVAAASEDDEVKPES